MILIGRFILKFFIPEWDDCVDRDYDFETDTISGSPDNRQNDYIWHIFGWEKVPIDGVLVSRAQLEKSVKKVTRARKIGYYDYLELPENIETIADCGAFDYIQELEPRYEPEDTLDFYYDLKINNGVTIDHIITNQKMEDKEDRFEITLANATKMYDLWLNKDKYYDSFRLIGAIQGWDTNSYKSALNELMDYGFRYIGVGGIAKTNTKFIKELVHEIGKTTKEFTRKHKERVDIHLFGFARAELLEDIANAGITSFDSASMLRKAWLASTSNYLKTYDKRYSAIRVRYAAEENEYLKLLEQDVLQSLHKYAHDELSFDKIKEKLSLYELETSESKYIDQYEETLSDRPWEECDCPICKKHNIEVCIFRGNNRNRRRGFHNTHVFYKHFRERIPRVLVFTTCTSTKDNANGLLPAYKRYSKSNGFKAWWNRVYDIPVIDIGIFSAKYGLIQWWDKIPDYDQKITDDDVDKFVELFSSILPQYDKVFFHGLGPYRKVIEKIKINTRHDIEIFPKFEFTDRNKLDIIEFMRQPKNLRDEILKYLSENHISMDIPEYQTEIISSKWNSQTAHSTHLSQNQ